MDYDTDDILIQASLEYVADEDRLYMDFKFWKRLCKCLSLLIRGYCKCQ